MIETLILKGDAVELIDQRILPLAFETVRCSNAHEMALAIRDMVVRGAPAIGVAAAYGYALEAQLHASASAPSFLSAMQVAGQCLLNSRPTAVNLAWAVQRMQTVQAQHLPAGPSACAQALLSEAIALHQQDIRINQNMGRHGAALLPDGARVLTHCNAGALATAGYGTALGVIRAAVESGKRISVFADETRPFLQGARLTAWELMQDQIPVTLITDNMSGYLMARGEIDAVVVGTDRVTANGDVVNKIGTYMVAVLAHRHNIPFYVACPISTIDIKTPTGAEVPIEERSAQEVLGFADVRWAPEGVAVRNPAFDVTPAALVTAIITERGIVHQPDPAGIAHLMQSL